jgi:hypothetical protein
VLLLGVALVLDRRGPEAAHDRRRAGEEEARHVLEEGPGGRRVAARAEGGGDAGNSRVVGKGSVDRLAVAIHDRERGPVIAQGDTPPMPAPVRPDREPAGIVEQGVCDDTGGSVVFRGVEGANLHRAGSCPKDASAARAG